MLLHVVSLASENPKNDYYTILDELSNYDKSMSEKESWIIFSKKDLVSQSKIDEVLESIDNIKNRVFVISAETGEGVKNLKDSLVSYLREG